MLVSLHQLYTCITPFIYHLRNSYIIIYNAIQYYTVLIAMSIATFYIYINVGRCTLFFKFHRKIGIGLPDPDKWYVGKLR